ncbi:hypothetical protein B0T26DRAFT_653862 [Lasiosphaeria miniovina]|uniref:Protein ECM13 n=1 Tax=Lasiosphaeria miniovina TaxID=1954250 RepID=A0AA40A4B4_9PEZI|nr:uncharacterized protein B0T26DRAFT_653862 [Lasiosphaeria miniovina]KAK0709037.1 hypothetical protein B0T26DRAFT_653862 [Lasiosphaeria miniovina]
MPSLHISTSSPTTRPKATSPSSPIVASAYKLQKAAKMSISQTYFLAHKARAKLSSEAARPDHNLRLLVGHANLLDSLMLELADAEREQESWFNQSVRGATKAENKHIKWADTVVEEPEQDWHAEDAESDSDSDSDSEFEDDEDIEMADVVSLRRILSHTNNKDYNYDMEEVDDDEEDFAQLALQRSPSHSASPPELDHDSDTSEDESMPPSPPTALLPTFSEKQKQSISTTGYYAAATSQDDKDAFYDEGYYLPPRNPARLVSAISVY